MAQRRRGDGVRARARASAAGRGCRRRRPCGPGGQEPVGACGGDHRVPRRGPRGVDDLLVPIAGVHRSRHRDARVVGDRRRRRGLDRSGGRRCSPGRQRGRGDIRAATERRRGARAGTACTAEHACTGRSRCGTTDSDQRHDRTAEAAVDQDLGARTHGLQRHQRGGLVRRRPAGTRVLAVRRDRRMSTDRRCVQRQADRDARAIQRRGLRGPGEAAPHRAFGRAAGRHTDVARRRRRQGGSCGWTS